MSEITEICKGCKLHVYTKAPPRQIVVVPVVTKFSENIEMDHKQLNGSWKLHTGSRFSIFINRKQLSTGNRIDMRMRNWIGKFVVVGALMINTTRECKSDEVREMRVNMNVQLCNLSRQSLFQSSLYEILHVVTDMMLVIVELIME